MNICKYTNKITSLKYYFATNREMSTNKGMSILEILIAIGIITFVCIPVIQILYSFSSSGSNNSFNSSAPKFFEPASIISLGYQNDGKIRTTLKKGGFWGVQSIFDSVYTSRPCVDFLNKSLPRYPDLHVYTNEELFQSSTTKATDIAFMGSSIIISTNSSSTTLPDIFMYSISNLNSYIYGTTTPFAHSSDVQKPINTKPELSLLTAIDTGPGISQIKSRGADIVLANTSVKNQAQVFKMDFPNMNSISKKIELRIPESNSSTTPITKKIIYTNNSIIVGTEKSVLPEIFIFDVYTGQVLGSIETGFGINDMLVVDGMLIVAGPRDPEIEIYDIHTYLKIGTHDLAGGSGNAKVLHMIGNLLYVGRTKGGTELEVLRLTKSVSQSVSQENKFSAPVLSSVFSKKIQWSIDALLKYNTYTMLFTADEYKEFQMYRDTLRYSAQSIVHSFFDIEGAVEGSLDVLHVVDLPDRVSSVACIKNSLWMTFKNDDPTNPFKIGVLIF